MPIFLILLGLGAAIALSTKGSRSTGGSDEIYIDARGRNWRIHRNGGPTSSGTVYPPKEPMATPISKFDFPEGRTRDQIIAAIQDY